MTIAFHLYNKTSNYPQHLNFELPCFRLYLVLPTVACWQATRDRASERVSERLSREERRKGELSLSFHAPRTRAALA